MMTKKITIKVYFDREYIGLEVNDDSEEFLRYVKDHKYAGNYENSILICKDGLKLIGKADFYKKVLRYYNGKAIIKHKTNSSHFFRYMSDLFCL